MYYFGPIKKLDRLQDMTVPIDTRVSFFCVSNFYNQSMKGFPKRSFELNQWQFD